MGRTDSWLYPAWKSVSTVVLRDASSYIDCAILALIHESRIFTFGREAGSITKKLSNLLTSSVELITTREVTIFATFRKFPSISLNPKIHYTPISTKSHIHIFCPQWWNIWRHCPIFHKTWMHTRDSAPEKKTKFVGAHGCLNCACQLYTTARISCWCSGFPLHNHSLWRPGTKSVENTIRTYFPGKARRLPKTSYEISLETFVITASCAVKGDVWNPPFAPCDFPFPSVHEYYFPVPLIFHFIIISFTFSFHVPFILQQLLHSSSFFL